MTALKVGDKVTDNKGRMQGIGIVLARVTDNAVDVEFVASDGLYRILAGQQRFTKVEDK